MTPLTDEQVARYAGGFQAAPIRALAVEVQEWRRLAVKAPTLVRTDRERSTALWRQERDARKTAEKLCDELGAALDDVDTGIAMADEMDDLECVDHRTIEALIERWRASQAARGET